jgi:hypothetical protein
MPNAPRINARLKKVLQFVFLWYNMCKPKSGYVGMFWIRQWIFGGESMPQARLRNNGNSI